MTPEARQELEAERDFLVRSLDDLEAERAAGDLDDGTYRALHDDYTARAAAVIRSLESGADLTPPEPPRPPATMRALTVAGILAFGLLAAFLLTRAVGQRHPGQTITGNGRVVSGPSATSADPGPELANEARAHPQSYAARIAYARYLLVQRNDYPDAIHEFGAAARIDPVQPEPPTYAGWAGALLAREIKDPTSRQPLLDAALQRIDEVIKTSPSYPDAYALKGVILFVFENDARHAIPAFQHFLVLTDDSNPMRGQVLSVLAQAMKAVGGSARTSTTGSPTGPPKSPTSRSSK